MTPNIPMRIEIIQKKTELIRHSAVVFFVCAIPALLSFLLWDQNVALYFRQEELIEFWLLAREVTNIGLSEHYFVLTIILFIGLKWLTPRIRRFDPHQKKIQMLKNWSVSFFYSLIFCGLFVHLFKFIFGRQRPHISEQLNAHLFYPLNWHWNYHSFPSGHSQVLFTVATMMSLLLPKWRWSFYVLAGLFASTRAITHDHFVSDVIMGSSVGYIGTLWCLYLLQKKHPLDPK